MSIVVAAAAVSVSSNTANAAYGFCIAPNAPNMFITRPAKPICYNGCDEWQVSSYRREIDDYFRKLKRYLTEVDTYYEDAYDYAKCMAELD
ncbi:hypothetical protein [Allosphingosinicella vermicomposti]|uniref:hypothetical protein n=1 Tax=Allosphingosinicella vermicomposti TaxID=614671 RepID=UPI00131A5D0A|nr:hypothetical protein [Allosphingosinicella vermicomposti]